VPPLQPSASPAPFDGLGRALRWLREKRGKKQYEVADEAGITKAMLSAYETEKQRPTLDSLEKILAALEIDLGDLFDTLQVVNERPAVPRYRWTGAPRETLAGQVPAIVDGIAVDVRTILGDDRVEPAEEDAVRAMVEGYFRWLRVLRRRADLAV
jgi:transcriptional regulator with XRE-family HTH domain